MRLCFNQIIKIFQLNRRIEKWKKRKGHAIHTVSDFGHNLIEWKDRLDDTKIINNTQGQIG